jgi:anti-sigma B factor antagonist
MPTEFTVDTVGDVTKVKIKTRQLWDLDLPEIGDQATSPQMHVDLGEVEILTSVALEVLIALRSRLRAAGGQLVLRNLTPGVHEIFQVTRLDQLFDIRQGDESA